MTQKERTHQRVIQAALRLFGRQGYTATTTRQIAQEAGIAELTLFRHFGSKENLAVQVFFSVCTHLFEELRAATERESTPEARLRAFVHTLRQFVDTYPEEFQFLHLTDLPQAVFEQQTFQPLKLFTRILEDLGVPVPPRALGLALVGTVERTWIGKRIGIISDEDQKKTLEWLLELVLQHAASPQKH